MRLLFDTNIVLDVLLARQPWLSDAQALWRAHDDGRCTGTLAASVLTDLYYIVRRHVHRDRALDSVRICLTTFDIATVSRATLERAVALPGLDFEDNLALACALELGLDGVVTRDPAGFRGSAATIYSPSQALAVLSRE